ncbi:MAG: alpha/beta fold hydrolase [Spirochaetes bacterium]|nr:alpha/beta fold hydrolase [Spirochaetota bacterium]
MKRILKYAAPALIALLAVLVATQYRRDIPPALLEKRYGAPPSRFITVEGLRVHYRDQGKGFPLVLIHGTASSLHTWDGWVDSMGGSFRIVRLDLPGFGLTGPNAIGDYRIGWYVEFLERFLESAGITRCHMAGNSLGGLIAWSYARSNPGKVDRLILVDPAGYPIEGRSFLGISRVPGINLLLRHITPRVLVAAGVREVYGDPSRVTEGLIDRYYEIMLREGNRQAMIDRGAVAREDLSPAIRELRLPVLVQWGALDRVIPPEHARRFAADIPGARVIVYPGLGHVPMEEAPAATARDAMAFLRR